MSPRLSLCTLLALAGTTCLASAATVTVHESLFNTMDATDGWSTDRMSTTPLGDRHFLGEFGNESAFLTIEEMPQHSVVNVSVELFVIRSWDGDEWPGPDVWEVLVDGEVFYSTTFANGDETKPGTQSFAGSNTEARGPAAGRTGANENNTLGYFFREQPRDSVYNLTFEIPHTGSEMVLGFRASGLQPINDESWGLGSVIVQAVTVPAPGALALLAGVPVVQRRRRRA
ncbi:MAG: hypothetical protein RBS39_02680 [Phycisphaerales bacterium]|jgi:hypothetical protein|nr:hypothetical protein [Phycisphaerales bacterium]